MESLYNNFTTTGDSDNLLCSNEKLASKFFETIGVSLGSCAVSNVSQEVLQFPEETEINMELTWSMLEFRLCLIFYQAIVLKAFGYHSLAKYLLLAFLFEGVPFQLVLLAHIFYRMAKYVVIFTLEDILASWPDSYISRWYFGSLCFTAESDDDFGLENLSPEGRSFVESIPPGRNGVENGYWREYRYHNSMFTIFHWTIYTQRIIHRSIHFTEYKQRLDMLKELDKAYIDYRFRYLMKEFCFCMKHYNPDIILDDDVLDIIQQMSFTQFRSESWLSTAKQVPPPKYVYLCEQAYLIIHLLKKISDGDDRTVNLALLTRVITNTSITELVTNACSGKEALFTFFLEKFSLEETPTKYKAESFLDVVADINAKASDSMKLLECDFYKKLINLGSLLLCVPVLNNMGITPEFVGIEKASEELMRKNYTQTQKLALPVVILENCTYIILKISQISKCGLSALYVSSREHEEFEEHYIWLRQRADNLARCNEMIDASGQRDPYTLEGYLNRCSQALHLAERIIPSVKKVTYMHRMITEQKLSILKYQSDCMAEMKANETRPQPYAVVLVGPPDIGKTTIGHALAQQMHQIDNAAGRFEVPFSPERIYNYEPGQDFYSGFRTDHSVIMLDDISQKTPEIMKTQEGGDLKDFISIVNSQPFTPNQAELHKKGTIPMRARYVIGNTNVADLSAQHIFAKPGAVYRRAVFIYCEPKKEFTGTGVSLRNSDPKNMDLWNFKIKKCFPNAEGYSWQFWDADKQRYVSQSAGPYNIKQLMSFIKIDMAAHWTKTSTAKESLEILSTAPKCRFCGLSINFCDGECQTPKFLAESYDGPPPNLLFEASSFVMYFCGYFYIYCVVIMYPIIYVLHSALEKISPRAFFESVSSSILSFVVWSTPNRAYMTSMQDWFRLNFPSIAYIFDAWYWWTLFESLKFKTKRAKRRFENFCTDINNLPYVLVFLGVLAAGLRYYRMQDAFSSETTVPVDTAMPKPDAEEKEKKNWWTKTSAIGSYPSRGRTIQTYHLATSCRLNAVLLEATFEDGKKGRTNAFIVRGNLLVTVNHFICKAIKKLEVLRLEKSPVNDVPQYTRFTTTIDDTCMYRLPESDLVFLRISRLVPGRDVTEFFPSNKEKIHINAVGSMYVVQPERKEHEDVSMKRVFECPDNVSYDISGLNTPARGCYIGVQLSSKTDKGYCGAPVTVTQGIEKMILGIHTASSNGTKTIIRPVYREQIEEADKAIESLRVLNDNDDDVCFSANAEAMEIVEANKKCPTKDIHGEYVVIGGNKMPRAKPRSHVQDTPYCAEMLEHFGLLAPEYVSPRTCSPRKAIKLAMDKVVENATFTPHEILFAVHTMATEFLNKMSDEQISRLRPYPYSVAINGCDGIPYVDRLNLKTSGGFGHSGPKRKMFVLGEPTDYHTVQYEATPELDSEVDYIFKQYLEGREANPVFKCCFKDEPISPEKAKIDKVRIFSGSPTAFSLVTRSMLLCIIREFVSSKRLNFEMAIGANAVGSDWEEIFNHVKKFGENRCFAGDYKAFDKQVPPDMILAAFEVIIMILEAAGWSEHEIAIVRGIATDTAFPTTDLFGTFVQLVGSNPSGHVLTTPINSLVNSLYMRIACRRILEKNGYTVGYDNTTNVDFTKFGEQVMSLVTYGDDNCGSIHPRFDCINHTSIQEALGEVGIIYTMDTKDAESVKYVSVFDISFLKRKFRIDPDLNRVLAPLDEKSIRKSLTVWTRSRDITQQQQMAEIILSAAREFFNYGKERFEKERAFFLSIIDKYDLRIWLPGEHLPTYDEIKSQCGFQ